MKKNLKEVILRHSRRNFLLNTVFAGAGFVFAPSLMGSPRKIDDRRPTPPFKNVVDDKFKLSRHAIIKGYVGKKLDQSYQNRILAQDINHLIKPFTVRTETRQWQSEFWGKWFTSAVLAYRYRPEPALKNILESAAKGLISTQSIDGYIGNYNKETRLEQWDIWGMKYCLLGLLDYYNLAANKASLDAAVKLADYLISAINGKDGIIVNKGNYRGMAASSVLEPIVGLYTTTRNQKYLSFAEEIVRQWETPGGPKLISKATVNVSDRFPKPKDWYSFEQGQKAYEMMSCYEGLLELYRVTGKDTYKVAAETTWQNIRDTEINIAGSGASEEMWFSGKKRQTQPVTHYQETCVTVTWIKFSQQLLRLTGDSKYADEIERSYYNALLGSLNSDGGDWAKYTPLNGQRLPGTGQCGMDLNCCNASGPRGQFTFPLTAVMSMQNGLSVNFFASGIYELNTPSGNKLSLIQKTDYPISGMIDITFDFVQAEDMTVQLRIPSWSKLTRVILNSKEVTSVSAGKYLEIKKKWSSKDTIQLELDMRGRVETVDNENGKYAAITRGPVVLARDSRMGAPHLSTVNQPVVDKQGFIELKPLQTATDGAYWMAYSALFVPESYAEGGAGPIPIKLIDYASAGNGKEKSTFQVWLSQLYSGRIN
jgi:DUF1680 family protein